MAAPARRFQQLRDKLGTEAGEELVTWLGDMESQHEKTRREMTELIRGVEARLTDRIHGVEVRVAEVKADLMKWSFVFWCGAVAAIAALAGVLRQ